MKIDFEFKTEFGIFKDSLTFFDENLPTAVEIENMKQARLDQWRKSIQTAQDIVIEE